MKKEIKTQYDKKVMYHAKRLANSIIRMISEEVIASKNKEIDINKYYYESAIEANSDVTLKSAGYIRKVLRLDNSLVIVYSEDDNAHSVCEVISAEDVNLEVLILLKRVIFK